MHSNRGYGTGKTWKNDLPFVTTEGDVLSPFVVRCLARIGLARGSEVLDIPCGFGRHAIWLARNGYRVTAGDLDAERVRAVQSDRLSLARDTNLYCLVLDAEADLPFSNSSFDLAMTVHFVSDALCRNIARTLRTGGYFIFETFGAQGNNWQSLPKLGAIRPLLTESFEILEFKERGVGPRQDRAVVQTFVVKR